MAEAGPIFNANQFWADKTFRGDNLWAQVKSALERTNQKLPLTPRRPDVRLIINNVSGETVEFFNPGQHSNQPEVISAEGDKTAAMAMIKGATLDEQMANARELVETFDLAAKGLSPDFVKALGTDATSDLIDEIYGPAPYEGQASKLVTLNWQTVDGADITIDPVNGDACAYGARTAALEKVFLVHAPLMVAGTTTTAEFIESSGMCISVSEDWETKEESSRPIVPSIAKDFYGAHFGNIPVATVDANSGLLKNIDLKNGKIIEMHLVPFLKDVPTAQSQGGGLALEM